MEALIRPSSPGHGYNFVSHLSQGGWTVHGVFPDREYVLPVLVHVVLDLWRLGDKTDLCGMPGQCLFRVQVGAMQGETVEDSDVA